MSNVTSLGTGSGLDLEGLVTKLIAATGKPIANRLDYKEAKIQAELSAFGALKSSLSDFQTKISGLVSSTDFQARSATTSNKDVVTVSASSTASTGNFNVNVTSLSAAHTLATPANDANYTFSSPNDVVGTGSLTFKFGTTTFVESPYSYAFSQNAAVSTQTVTFDSSDNTLEGIKDKINSLNIGVTASIIKDANEYRLAFVSTNTGLSNSLQISVNDTGDANNTDTSGLSRLAFNGNSGTDNTNLLQTASAADAALTINGIAITSESNRIVDIVDGVTLDLITTGSSNLSISQDKTKATTTVDSFISSYNDLIDIFTVLSDLDEETEVAGTLLGDSTLRRISQSIKYVLQAPITGVGGAYNSLAAAGITTDNDGKLVKDSTKFQKVLDNSFDSIASMFSASSVLSDALIDYDSSTNDTKIGTYNLNITQLALQSTFVGGSAASGAPGSIVVASGSSDTFSLKVDGVQSASLTLTAGTQSGSDLATEMQSLINGDSTLASNGVAVNVAFNSTTNKFEITSSRYGSASKVENLGGNALINLGLDTKDTTNSIDGVDVAGSIGSSVATGSGRYLTGVGDAKGLKLEITGGATGNRGTTVFSRGYADQLNSLLTTFLTTDKIIDTRTDGLNTQLEEIDDSRVALTKRLEIQEIRLRSRFVALDGLISQLNSTSGFLQQQLSNINIIANSSLKKR